MMRLLVQFIFISVVSILLRSTAGLEGPEGISPEMYCAGCEVTVKELDFVLRRRPTRGMGETVTRALKSLCKIHNFDKHEINAKAALKVCEHIIGDEEMQATLISEYGKKHELGLQTTYLDMTQKICGKALQACEGNTILEVDEEEGGITFDAETQDFEIKYGSKVRTPNPIRLGEPAVNKQEPEPLQQVKIDLHREEELSNIHKHEEL